MAAEVRQLRREVDVLHAQHSAAAAMVAAAPVTLKSLRRAVGALAHTSTAAAGTHALYSTESDRGREWNCRSAETRGHWCS
jgi:hypothetical protein